MSKYILINVQGVHDVYTEVFDNLYQLEKRLDMFFDFCEDKEHSKDELLPCGEINRDYQTLKVIQID